MRNVFFFSLQPDDPTSFYRMSGVLPYINHPGLTIKDISDTRNFSWATYTGCDVFIIQRPFNDQHIQMITLAKDMGIKVIVDFDDNLLGVDMFNPTYKMYQRYRKSCMECIALADEVWVSTQGIKEAYQALNTNIHIIPNAHNDFLFPVKVKKKFNPETKLAVWRGGLSHEADVYAFKDDITSMINSNIDWEFRFLGCRFAAIELHTGDNHTLVEPLTLIQYFNYFYDSNPNIVFFPLRDTELNRGKSCISWMEATYAGAAFMGATNLPEFSISSIYTFSGEQFDTIRDDKEILQESNERSWEYIKDNLLLSRVNNQRIKRLLQ